MGSEEKATEYWEKAEKKMKGFSLFGGSSKFEEAGDLYTKAANLFKTSKKWDQAGEAYLKAAECSLKLQSAHEAATNYVNASGCFKKNNISRSISCLKQAVEFYTDEGRFSVAAKHQKEIAELYEAENDFDSAIANFQLAADFYDGEGSASASNQCLLKVASFSALLERYDKAVELYEKIAVSSIDNNLLKWSVKDYFLRAGLCHLASGDLVATRRAFDRYQDMDVTFSGQREYKLLVDLLSACENMDLEAFTLATKEFDSLSKLDSWKVSLLLKIKNSIKEEDTLV